MNSRALLRHRTLILLLILGWAKLLSGQAYHPFPTNGTWYYQRYADMGQLLPGYDVFKTAGDTILGGHTYKKLFLNAVYDGALRDSSKRVYYRASAAAEEVVLYDFNRETGDTIILPFPLMPTGLCDTFFVSGEDQFPTLDGSRRQLNLAGCNGVTWIEGIGNTWWLTNPPYLNSVSGGSYLTCFFDSTQLVYALEGSLCSAGLSASMDDAVDFPVFPNPTTGVLFFPELPDKVLSISVTDLTGRSVLHGGINVNTLDISAFPDGIYLVKVQTKAKLITRRVVKGK